MKSRRLGDDKNDRKQRHAGECEPRDGTGPCHQSTRNFVQTAASFALEAGTGRDLTGGYDKLEGGVQEVNGTPSARIDLLSGRCI